MDLKEDQILGKSVANHWYYRSKAAAMLRFVAHLHAKNLLDVGAGSGFFSKYLLTHTTAETAWCIDPYYPEEREENHAGKPIQFRHECSESNADLVLMMDVLEHVDDDLALLSEYINKVSSGSHFLITVPAFQFLWSGHDVFLGHYRRYTLSDVTKLMEAAGLVVEQRAYYFGLVFPLAAAMRLAGKLLGRNADEPHSELKQHNPLTNSVLSMVCKAELPVFKFNRLAGLSVFCLARKV